jgi:hypothetical protein
MTVRPILGRTSRDSDGMTILNSLSVALIRLGLHLQMVGFRRELNQRLDDGTVELWANKYGLDEDGCVCSEAACSQPLRRRLMATSAEKAASILSGAGRSKSDQAPSGKASEKAKAILGTSAADKAAAILGDSGGSAKKGKSTNPVVAVLGALDTGRRGVAAVLKELDDLVPGTGRDRAKSDGFSLADIPANFRQNIGAGDLVDTGNKWVDRGVGLAGDIATDPLSYLTLGAAPAAQASAKAEAILNAAAKAGRSIGKEEVARALTKAAAESGDKSLTELAAKVARRGTGSLTAEEAAHVGIRQGAQFGVGTAKVTLPGTGGLARAVDAATGPIKDAVYGGKLAGRLENVLNAVDPSNKLSRTGLPRAEALSAEGPLKKLVLVDQTRLARGEARALAVSSRKELEDISTRYKGLNPEALRRVVQGESAKTATERAAAADVRTLLERVRSEASRLARKDVGHLDDYLPVTFSDDLRKLVSAKRGTSLSATPRAVKERKVFVAGGKFLGVTLEGANPQQVLDHAERVAREKLGDGAVELFEKNPFKLIDRYIGGMERFAADHALAARLGTTVDEVTGVRASGLGPRLDNAAEVHRIERDAEVVNPLLTQGSPNRPDQALTVVSEEHDLRLDAEELWHSAELAASAGDHGPAAIAALEASAKAELASTPPVSADQMRAVFEDGHKVTDTAVAGLKLLSAGDDQWVAESLTNLWKAGAFTEKGWFLNAFDKVTSVWKGLAILSPGFHVRNYSGGIFNNALAGVDIGSYKVFATEWSAFRKATDAAVMGGATRATAEQAALRAVDGQYREAFEAMRQYGLLGSSTGRDFADVAGKTSQNRVLAANRKASTAVENNLRGTLFLDRMLKGASTEDALGAVGTYHFFYDETSPFFQSFVKRAVPFATWSRFNFPLQLEGIARKPGLYSRFTHLANNVELGGEDGEEPPAWMQSLMAIKSPFLAPGGRQLFLTPDLPFRDLGETFDTGKLKASLNPLAKVALEASAGKRFFSDTQFKRGDQETPTTWVPVVAALYALGPLTKHLGLPSIKRDGTSFTLNDADVNKIESLIPVLGRLKRLAPSDDRSQAKAFSSWLSFAFGISTQTIIDNADAVTAASGVLGSKARTKAAVTASRPTSTRTPSGTPKSSGIRPSGSGAPTNAVIAGSYNAKPYQGGT